MTPRAPVPRFEAWTKVDLDAPVGRYAIDALVPGLLGTRESGAIRLARRIVGDAARQAWHEADRVMRARTEYEAARDMLERLERIERDCFAIERLDVGLSFWPSEDDGEDPIFTQLNALDDIRCAATAFRQAAERFRRENFVGSRPVLGRARPLERAFVARFRTLWLERTGRTVPTSRTGPFVDFICAAWRDVGFPVLAADDDALAIYMGRALSA